MAVHIDEQALQTAAADMMKLKERNEALRSRLEELFKGLTTALDTPSGEAVEITGRDILLEPIEQMGLVLEHVSNTLNIIIGAGGESKGVYYDKLFEEYEELEQLLKSK